jgi:hypothetical protein
MQAILIILGVIVLVWLVKEVRKRTKIMRTQITYLGTDADMPDEYSTYIAGINYRCTGFDIGGFLGFAIPQQNNKYDKNAVGVYKKDGMLLGYIPKDEAKEFREWCNMHPVPCVGYIRKENNKLQGRIKALLPENEKAVSRATAYYVRWLVEKYGRKFVPTGFTVNRKRTDEETISAINEYINGV